jgi:hypothetical protein
LSYVVLNYPNFTDRVVAAQKITINFKFYVAFNLFNLFIIHDKLFNLLDLREM